VRGLRPAPPASRRIDTTSGFGVSDMADYLPRFVYDANDPCETNAAQNFCGAT
jgi:hypothetical protein